MTAEPTLADRLIKDAIPSADEQVLRAALTAVLEERDKYRARAATFSRCVGLAEGHLTQGRCEGQHLAYEAAADHLNECLLTTLDLWSAYERAEGVEPPG